MHRRINNTDMRRSVKPSLQIERRVSVCRAINQSANLICLQEVYSFVVSETTTGARGRCLLKSLLDTERWYNERLIHTSIRLVDKRKPHRPVPSRLTHHDHCPRCLLVFISHSLNVVEQDSNKKMIRLVKVITTIRVLEDAF